MYKVFVLGLIICISACTYEVVMDESHVINSDFVYEKINYKTSINMPEFEQYSYNVTGAITNNSGVLLRYAKFELTTLDDEGNITDVSSFFITNFHSYTTRHFKLLVFVTARGVGDYKIQYIGII